MKYSILDQKRHWMYFVLFMIGIILIIWEITIYRITIIDFKVPILLIITIGTFMYLMDIKRYSETYEIRYVKLFAWIQNTVSWGFIACTVFMAINKYFAVDNSHTAEYQIDNMSTMAGRPRTKSNERLLVRVKYKDDIKELVFSKEQLKQMETSKSVTLKTKKGFFGYDIIEEQIMNN